MPVTSTMAANCINSRCKLSFFVPWQVGSGKSSLLAALLGELQPLDASLSSLQQPGAAAIDTDTGPVMKGTVAYCCQVPWVDAGTIRVSLCQASDFSLGGCHGVCWYFVSLLVLHKHALGPSPRYGACFLFVTGINAAMVTCCC